MLVLLVLGRRAQFDLQTNVFLPVYMARALKTAFKFNANSSRRLSREGSHVIHGSAHGGVRANKCVSGDDDESSSIEKVDEPSSQCCCELSFLHTLHNGCDRKLFRRTNVWLMQEEVCTIHPYTSMRCVQRKKVAMLWPVTMLTFILSHFFTLTF